jgi:hypothetical protein
MSLHYGKISRSSTNLDGMICIIAENTVYGLGSEVSDVTNSLSVLTPEVIFSAWSQ